MRIDDFENVVVALASKTTEPESVMVIPIAPTLIDRAQYLAAPDKYFLLTDEFGKFSHRLEWLLKMARIAKAAQCDAESKSEAINTEGVSK